MKPGDPTDNLQERTIKVYLEAQIDRVLARLEEALSERSQYLGHYAPPQAFTECAKIAALRQRVLKFRSDVSWLTQLDRLNSINEILHGRAGKKIDAKTEPI